LAGTQCAACGFWGNGPICRYAAGTFKASAADAGFAAAPTKPATQPASARATVWADAATGYYHRPDSRHYGKTKRDKCLMEGDAIRASFGSAQN